MSEIKYFDKVKLIDGTYAEVCDRVARAAIQGGTYFIGIATSEITDGSDQNPVEINNEMVDAVNGNIIVYENKEFIFSGMDNCWHELGDLTNLGELAYLDSASTVYTPEGYVTKPEIEVVTVTEPIKASITEGSVIHGMANVPTSVTLPTLTMSASGNVLELTWESGSVTPGVASIPTSVTLPETKDIEAVTSLSAELVEEPQFVGTEQTIIVN